MNRKVRSRDVTYPLTVQGIEPVTTTKHSQFLVEALFWSEVMSLGCYRTWTRTKPLLRTENVFGICDPVKCHCKVNGMVLSGRHRWLRKFWHILTYINEALMEVQCLGGWILGWAAVKKGVLIGPMVRSTFHLQTAGLIGIHNRLWRIHKCLSVSLLLTKI